MSQHNSAQIHLGYKHTTINVDVSISIEEISDIQLNDKNNYGYHVWLLVNCKIVKLVTVAMLLSLLNFIDIITFQYNRIRS